MFTPAEPTAAVPSRSPLGSCRPLILEEPPPGQEDRPAGSRRYFGVTVCGSRCQLPSEDDKIGGQKHIR
jgi:hypothetical protein